MSFRLLLTVVFPPLLWVKGLGYPLFLVSGYFLFKGLDGCLMKKA